MKTYNIPIKIKKLMNTSVLPCSLIFLCSANLLAIGLTYTLPPGTAEAGDAATGVAGGGTGGVAIGGGGAAAPGGGVATAVGAGFAATESSLKSLKAATCASSSTIIQTNLPENRKFTIYNS